MKCLVSREASQSGHEVGEVYENGLQIMMRETKQETRCEDQSARRGGARGLSLEVEVSRSETTYHVSQSCQSFSQRYNAMSLLFLSQTE